MISFLSFIENRKSEFFLIVTLQRGLTQVPKEESEELWKETLITFQDTMDNNLNCMLLNWKLQDKGGLETKIKKKYE